MPEPEARRSGLRAADLLSAVGSLLSTAVALLLGLVVQLAAVLLALRLVAPDATITLGTAAVTLLAVGLIGALLRWCLAAGDHEYVVADLVARARRRARSPDVAVREPGVVIVQVDGLPYPLLHQGVVSGDLPTVARWVRSGEYTARRWWARVPSTTPASQAGLLHGSNAGIPAFRWYDPQLERLVVANRPADAALIEERLTDGRGLLADGGVSIGKLFTGDAPTNLLAFASPFVLARATLSTVGEMVKELFQARQQRARGILPRTHRGWDYVALRGLTNAMMRHLTVALAAERMVRGAPVVYVNLVDCDEIAHHTGPARREALDALAGLDRVLGTFEEILPAAGRDYRFVVLSDHGQSQGPTFRQLAGRSLEEVVRSPTAGTAHAVAATGDAESWGQLNALLADVLSASRVTAPLAERRARRPAGESADAYGRRPEPDPRLDLLRVASMVEAPDVLVHSTLDPDTAEVHAFEELMGSHGGLGGNRNHPVLLHPAAWPVDADLLSRVDSADTADSADPARSADPAVLGPRGPEGVLHGAENVHRQIVRWLEAAGLRRDRGSEPPTDGSPRPDDIDRARPGAG